MQREVSVKTAESGDEMVLECANGSFSRIPSVHVGWNQLVINIFVLHVLFEDGGCFIVKALEKGAQASSTQPLVALLVGCKDVSGRPSLHGDRHDEIAVIVVDDHDVVVASAGGDDESASLVGVDLAGGLVRDGTGGVMDGRIAKESASPVGWACWERIGRGIVGQGERGRGRGGVVNWLIVALGRLAKVRPAMPGTRLRRRAVSRVARAGLNRAAWAKATKLAGPDVVWWSARADSGSVEADVDGGLDGRSISHNPVSDVRVPERTVWPWKETLTVVGSKETVHPWSQSWPMDRSGLQERAGTMWPCRAARGRPGMVNSAVWVDCMRSPLGLAMEIGGLAGWTLVTGVAGVKKWEVQPVSAIARIGGGTGLRGERGAEGGPQGGALVKDSVLSLLVSGDGAAVARLICGFPPCQVLGVGGLRVRAPLLLRDKMVWHPPMMLWKVALAQWPSFGLRQLALVWLALGVYPWDQQ